MDELRIGTLGSIEMNIKESSMILSMIIYYWREI